MRAENPLPNTENGKNLLEHLDKISANMEQIISENYYWLCCRTTSVSELGDKLVSKRQLDLATKTRIMTENDLDADQSREIYREVAKLENWKELILAWEGSNDHIVKLLLEALCKKYPKEAAEGRNRKPDRENHTESPLLKKVCHHMGINKIENRNKTNAENASLIWKYALGDEEKNLKSSHENRKVDFPLTRVLTPEFIYFAIIITMTLAGASALLLRDLGQIQSNSSSTLPISGKKLSSLIIENTIDAYPVPLGNNTTDGATTEIPVSSISAYNGDNFAIENWSSASPKIRKFPPGAFIIFKLTDLVTNLEIHDPRNTSAATKNPDRPYLLIVRNNSHDWENLNTTIPGSEQNIAFNGSINPENVTAIIETFRHSLANITFIFGNMLCGEFANFEISLNRSTVEIPLLREMQFVGDDNCCHVFQLVAYYLSFKNIKVLKLVGNHIMPDSVSFIKEILRLSQNTLEHLILQNVSFCNNCNSFENLYFPNMKHAELVFRLGVNEPFRQDIWAAFNRIMPENCNSHNPDTKSLVVKCP